MKRIFGLVLCICLMGILPAHAAHITREVNADGNAYSIDAELFILENMQAESVRVAAYQWTEEELNDLFFGGEDVAYKYSTSEPEIVDGNMLKRNIIHDRDEKGYIVTAVTGYLQYCSPRINNTAMYGLSYLAEAFSDEEIVLDEAAALAVEAAKAQAAAYGFDTGEILSIQFCDAEFQQKNYFSCEEGYSVTLEASINGMPCYPRSYRCYSEVTINGSYVQAYVVNGEVLYFQTASAYDAMGEPETLDAELLDLEEAIACMTDFCANVFMRDTITIKQIRLCYLPRQIHNKLYTYEMRPAWCFLTEEESFLFDAVTGDKI